MLRPVGGFDEEITGVLPAIEPVESATFRLPGHQDLGDFTSGRLLREAARLSTRAAAGPFRSFGRIAVEPRPYQLVPLMMALSRPTRRFPRARTRRPSTGSALPTASSSTASSPSRVRDRYSRPKASPSRFIRCSMSSSACSARCRNRLRSQCLRLVPPIETSARIRDSCTESLASPVRKRRFRATLWAGPCPPRPARTGGDRP